MQQCRLRAGRPPCSAPPSLLHAARALWMSPPRAVILPSGVLEQGRPPVQTHMWPPTATTCPEQGDPLFRCLYLLLVFVGKRGPSLFRAPLASNGKKCALNRGTPLFNTNMLSEQGAPLFNGHSVRYMRGLNRQACLFGGDTASSHGPTFHCEIVCAWFWLCFLSSACLWVSWLTCWYLVWVAGAPGQEF